MTTNRRSRSKLMMAATFLGIVLLSAALVLLVLATPRISDLPSDVSVKETSLAGKRYLLVDGARNRGFGMLSVVRAYQSGDHVLALDTAEAYFVPFGNRPVVNSLPLLVDLSHLEKGRWTVTARRNGSYVKLSEFDDLESLER